MLPPVTVIGYGSLMSAYGMGRDGAIVARRVRRVQLHNARRGYGKASRHGNLFAMVLEPIEPDVPLSASGLEPADAGVAPQAVAIDFPASFLPSLATREGYSAEAARRLLAAARDATTGPAAYLAAALSRAGGDAARYRSHLARQVAYTSGHYIPHPIDLDGSPAIVFLAPGEEGTGSSTVAPIRVETGVCELMTTREVWHRRANDDQLDYIAMCLLASAHGVCVDDLSRDLDPDLVERLRAYDLRFAREASSLRALLDITDSAYRQFRGPPRVWPAR